VSGNAGEAPGVVPRAGSGKEPAMNEQVAIPWRFYDDHRACGLPTPAVLRVQGQDYVVDLFDPAIDALLGNARQFAEGPNASFWARRTLAVLEPAKAAIEREVNERLDAMQPESCSAEMRNAIHACRHGHPLCDPRGRAELFENAAFMLIGQVSTLDRNWLRMMAAHCRKARSAKEAG
jgi:hypothetical protein